MYLVSLTRTASAPNATSPVQPAKPGNAWLLKSLLSPSFLPEGIRRGSELPSPLQRSLPTLAPDVPAFAFVRRDDPAPRPEVFYRRDPSTFGTETAAPSLLQTRPVGRPEVPGPAREYAPSWCF